MQRKWFAIVLAVAVLSVVVVSMAEEESVADNSAEDNTVIYHAAVGSEYRNIDIIINENYFKKVDPSSIVKWSYLNGDQYSSITIGTGIDTGDVSFILKDDDLGIVGKYVLSLKSDISEETMITLKLRCDITVRYTGNNEVTTYNTESLFVEVQMSLNGGNNLPTVLEYNDGNTVYRFDRITVMEGVPVDLEPSIGSGSHPRDFNWYAIKLPKGMAMTKDGTISGVPVEHGSEPETSYAYIEDRYGNSTFFELKILVLDSQHRVSFYLYNGEITTTTDESELVHEPTQFITQRDRVVTLAIVGNDAMKISVVGVNEQGEPSRVELGTPQVVTIGEGSQETNYYCYKLPTQGTGMYKVEITDNDNVRQDVFDLYVMSKLLAVESEIIVGSDGIN